MTIRVLLADDHLAIRVSIRGALTKVPGIAVVGEAEDGEGALHLIKEQRPDVAVLGCRLPGLSAAEVAVRLWEWRLPTQVLALSIHPDDQYDYRMPKKILETLLKAVQAMVREQQEWLSPWATLRVLAWKQKEALLPRMEKLTRRELEILRLLARGRDNQCIAGELNIGERTVKNYVTSIYSKLGMRSRAEAVAWAWEHGLME